MGEGKIELVYNLMSLDEDDKTKRYYVYSNKSGVITDIKLDKLKDFAKILEKEANKNGFSFYREKINLKNTPASRTNTTEEIDTTKINLANRHLLHKKYRDKIDEGKQTLVSIEKKVIKDTAVLRKLSKLARDAFIIKKQDNFSEEIKLEIEGLQDQSISAIQDKKTGKIKELVKIFISLVETFLESLNIFGGGHSYEQAREERGAIFGGWNEIRWLSDCIRELYKKAAQSHDSDVIRDVAYLPFAISIRAIKAGDQYVYQEFLKYPMFLYWFALKEETKEIRDLMTDRSWRQLKDISSYYIEYQLKRELSDIVSIKKYWDFTIPIFTAFQNLIKTAFDNRNFDNFQTFLNHFSTLYHDFKPDNDYPNAEHLRRVLDWTQDEIEKKDILCKLEKQEEKERVAKDIQLKKMQVVFGLTSWIFEQYRKHSTDESLSKFYSDIAGKLTNTLPELTELYLSSRQFDTEEFWGWDNWDMIPDGSAHWIDFHSKLDRMYCIKALLILHGMSQELIDSIVLPLSRDLADLAADRPDSRVLNSILDDIGSSPLQWSFVLPQTAIDKISVLKTLLSKVKAAQQKGEEEFLITAEIDPEKIRIFKSEVVESFHRSGCLRSVLQKYGAYKDLTSKSPDKKRISWGYNQIDNKAAFISDWHVQYPKWGENYGNGMARSEDQFIFKKILANVGKEINSAKQQINQEIENVLKSKNFENPIIIQTLDRLYEFEQFNNSEVFIPEYYRECPGTKLDKMNGYIGVIKLADRHLPVVDLFVNIAKLKNKILVIDIDKFGILKQFSPIDDSADIGDQFDIFLIQVIDLNKNDERRQKIINQKPVWLEKQSDKEGYLRQSVLINLYQKYEFETVKPEAACCISINDLHAVDDEEG